jgi:hypothetical protein
MHKGVGVSQPGLRGVMSWELVVFHGQVWKRLSSDAEAKDAGIRLTSFIWRERMQSHPSKKRDAHQSDLRSSRFVDLIRLET